MPEIGERHHTTHEDGGNDEIDVTALTGRINYVDRGDASAWDFTITDFPIIGALTDISFASIVPVGTKRISARVQVTSNAVGRLFSLCKKGYTQGYNMAMITALVANYSFIMDLEIDLDSNRMASYYLSENTFTEISIFVRGWWI